MHRSSLACLPTSGGPLGEQRIASLVGARAWGRPQIHLRTQPRLKDEEEGGGSFLFGNCSSPGPGPAAKAHRVGAPTPGVERPLASTPWGARVVVGVLQDRVRSLSPSLPSAGTSRPHPRVAPAKFRREGESARRPRPHHGPAADNGGAESARRPGSPTRDRSPPSPPLPARPASGARSRIPGYG